MNKIKFEMSNDNGGLRFDIFVNGKPQCDSIRNILSEQNFCIIEHIINGELNQVVIRI